MFDRGRIWVTNELNNTVTKLLARDGSVLGTFAVQGGSRAGPPFPFSLPSPAGHPL